MPIHPLLILVHPPKARPEICIIQGDQWLQNEYGTLEFQKNPSIDSRLARLGLVSHSFTSPHYNFTFALYITSSASRPLPHHLHFISASASADEN